MKKHAKIPLHDENPDCIKGNLRHRNTILESINRILYMALTCETEEQLSGLCLSVAKDLTKSKFGFIGESGPDGKLRNIAISDPGWRQCAMHDKTGHRGPLGNVELHGLYDRVLHDGKSLFTNDPSTHPDSIGLPEGHPPLKSFLGAPLVQSGKTIGVLALGNREKGYTRREQHALEAIGPAIVQALMSKRTEESLRASETRLRRALKSVRTTEGTLRERDAKYRTLYNSIDEGFFLIDVIFDENDRPVDLFYVEANAAATRMLGTDYTGKRLKEIDPDYESYWYDIFGGVALTGESVRQEKYAAPDKKWYDFYVFKVGGKKSRRIGNTFKDITERKKSESALLQAKDEALRRAKEAEDQGQVLTAMMEHIPIGITVADAPDVTIRAVSRFGQELIGRTSGQLEGVSVDRHADTWDIYHVDGTKATNEELPLTRATRKGEIVRDEEWVLGRSDGKRITTLCTAAPILDAQRRITGGVIGWQDITERKKTEENLLNSESRFRVIAETASHLLESRDPQKSIEVCAEGSCSTSAAKFSSIS